jgi:hypothetical protein
MPGFFLTETTQKNNIFDLSLIRKRSRRERLDSLSEADADDEFQNDIYEQRQGRMIPARRKIDTHYE